jgi:hypothetical protein
MLPEAPPFPAGPRVPAESETRLISRTFLQTEHPEETGSAHHAPHLPRLHLESLGPDESVCFDLPASAQLKLT